MILPIDRINSFGQVTFQNMTLDNAVPIRKRCAINDRGKCENLAANSK